MITELCLNSIHWRVAKDPWTIALFQSAGSQFDIQANRIVDIYNFNNFDKLSLKYIEYFEDRLGIPHDDDKTLADRRATIAAYWKTGDPPTKIVLEAICNGWLAGECEITFLGNGYIQVAFNSILGVPADLATLQEALLTVIPAHLGIHYKYNYLLIRDVQAMTINEMQATEINKFAGRRD